MWRLAQPNAAATVTFVVTVTAQVGEETKTPAQAPPHKVSRRPTSGIAVKVTVAPVGTCSPSSTLSSPARAADKVPPPETENDTARSRAAHISPSGEASKPASHSQRKFTKLAFAGQARQGGTGMSGFTS